jgi:glycosyltransferase involved in cell wall biosynthesis
MSIRVLHVVSSLRREDGGLPAAVVGLASAQAAAGLTVGIAVQESGDFRELSAWWASTMPAFRQVELHSVTSGPGAIARLIKRYDVAHIHGIWRPFQAWACYCAQRSGLVTVITPHGMLSPWSLQQKWIRKRVALTVAWNRLIRRAVLHALNGEEARVLKARFPGVPVHVVSNGVSLHDVDTGHVDGSSGRRYVLFLARLHIVKGPDRLVDAFRIVADRVDDLDLLIAGPDAGIHHALQAQIARHGLESRVTLLGAVYGAPKIALMRGALCVCQPSRHEASSVTLLEVLGCGVPVITTAEANFPEIAQNGVGAVVAGDARSLSDEIIRLAENPALRHDQAIAARSLVERHYTWEAVEQRVSAIYAAQLGDRPVSMQPAHGSTTP